jgi:NAD(P)H-flavin reductase
MTPQSDCIIRIPATSDVAKTSISTYSGELAVNKQLSDTALAFSIKVDDRSTLAFLPGQYVNVQVPGTDQARSFSFSSGPGADEVGFLIRNTTYGVLTTYLRDRAKVGDKISFNGPLGSFYLRAINRPVLFLAGGTGLAPFLSMLHKIEADGGGEHPIHLIFGVTNDPDLVEVEALDGYASRMPNFAYTCVVAAEESSYPNKGFVTHHMKPELLHDGSVDIYLCGPPPMVDAVRKYLSDQGIEPASFYYEKFSGSGVVSEIGESHVKAVDSDEAFDARMALELGAAQLVVGRLGSEQLAEYRVLAEATGQYIKDGRFTDPAGFRDANSAFHLFPIEATGNGVLVEAYRKLLVQEYMGQVLTPSVDLVGDITTDHVHIVDAFERGDFEALRAIIAEHTDHAKATMRAGIDKPGG